MKLQQILNTKAAAVSFMIVWAINETILVNITKTQIPQVWWLVKLVAALGIYTFLYQVISYFIHTRFVLRTSKEGKLLGEWYQIFQINNYSSEHPNDHIRFGKVSINLDSENLEITAISNKLSDKSSNSHWYSDQVSVRGQKIWLLFTSSGPGRGTTLGTMELHFQGNNPEAMSGAFHDASPSKNFGNMELYRSKDAYQKRLEELMIKDND